VENMAKLNLKTDRFIIKHNYKDDSFTVTNIDGSSLYGLKKEDPLHGDFSKDFSQTGQDGLNGLVEKYRALVGAAT
jgi:hypothetical protein